MEKIETIYERDESSRGHPVIPGIKGECAWVEAGEGIATRKVDGSNVQVEDGQLFKRQKPKGRDYDRASYAACDPDNPADKWFYLAMSHTPRPARPEGEKQSVPDGIYEAVGPHFQGNPEKLEFDRLVRVIPIDPWLIIRGDVPRTFKGLHTYLADNEIEGIVFHHPDGRLAKIKRRDFGFPWPILTGNRRG